MKKFKIIILSSVMIFMVGCGYTPLLNTQNINFYISEINYEGDRNVNNYIKNNLKKYGKFKENSKKYDLNITSTYNKVVANKDENGNPKNYNLKVKVEVIFNSLNDSSSKTFEKNISLGIQDKKVKEKELEKKYKKDLSESISKDIVFYFMTN
tara:strand:+ start:273 stop:731 length:459 start_codon:yes stop_codon:yes gene_type:complete